MSDDFDDRTPEIPATIDGLRAELARQRRQLQGGAKTFSTMRKILVAVGIAVLGSVGTVIHGAYRAGAAGEQLEQGKRALEAAQTELARQGIQLRDADTEQKLMQKDLKNITEATVRIETALAKKKGR